MFCSTITTKGTPCKRGIVTGCSIYLDGYVMHCCRAHYKAINEGTLMLPFLQFDISRRTVHHTIAVTTSEEDTMHTHLPTNTTIIQPTLFSEIRTKIDEANRKAAERMAAQHTEIDGIVRTIISEGIDKIYYQQTTLNKRFTGTTEEFKARCAEILATAPREIKGFAIRVSNEIFYVTRNKSVKTTKKMVAARTENWRTR